MRVRDGDAEAGPVEELAVVLAVAARDGLRRGEAEPVGDELEPRALAHVRMRELEEVRQRLRDEEPAGEARLQLGLELVERLRVADGDELRRVVVQPLVQRADDVDLDPLEVGVRARLRRHLGDVQLVVDVAVDVEAGVDDGVDRLERDGARNRNVPQELAGHRVGDDGALVADDRIVEPRLLEIRDARRGTCGP